MKRIIPIYLILIGFHFRMVAQFPYAEVISQEKGFGNASVTALLEDHLGVIWAGTELGLIKFDGLQTVAYLPEKGNKNSISNEYIYDLFEDSQHTIWVATRGGLNRIDASRKIITRYLLNSADSTTIPNDRVYELIPDTDSTFFLICDKSGLSEFNSKTGKTKRLDLKVMSKIYPQYNGKAILYRGFKNQDGKLYVMNISGLSEFNREKNLLTDIPDTITGIKDLTYYGNYCPTSEGIMWFSDMKGVLYKWSAYHFLESFTHTELTNNFKPGQFSIKEYNHSFMLMSNHEGYWLVGKECGDIQPFKFREDQNIELRYGSIKSCLETQKGIVVLGASNGDVYMIDPLLQQFNYKNLSPGDANSEFQVSTNSFIEDPEHHLRYISVLQDSAFYVEDYFGGEIRKIYKPRVTNIANNWLLDHKGRLWLCDGTSIKEINREDQSMTSYAPEAGARNLFDMVEIRPGQMMAGTLIEGLYYFEPDQNKFEPVPDGRGWTKTSIYSLKNDKKHNSIWIGTQSLGLYRYDITLDTFYHYQYDSNNPHSLGGDFVKDITLDSLGYVWFARDPGGLSRFDYEANPDSAFLNLSMEDGLPTHYITSLETDRKGQIWMTSLNGIASLQPTDFSIQHYGKSDGLTKSKFVQTSMFVSWDNTVLIGTSHGYIYFKPRRLIKNTSPPGLEINDVLVFGKSRLTHDVAGHYAPLAFNYKENYLTFQFSVINFTEPEHNTVKYILEGFDDEWNIRSGIHEVNYTKVPPGSYTFRIQAANNDGVWNPEEQAISILIRPPFWQTTWFYILLGALISGIVFALYSYKLRQTIKQKLLVAEKEWLKKESERQLTQLEMKALRAQMNPHFIFNCLNSINRFIVVNDNDSASEYLTKFSRLIRQVLDNSRGEKVGLGTEIETLKLYIEMESLRFSNKFEYSITIQPGFQLESYMVQPMLIQPYVENAIWHGLMHRKDKGQLQVNISHQAESLCVVIEDNGVGRSMAKKIKEGQLITRKSHGMQVTAERMSLLSQRMNMTVEAVVHDLYDEHDQALGTKVVITLPLELKM